MIITWNYFYLITLDIYMSEYLHFFVILLFFLGFFHLHFMDFQCFFLSFSLLFSCLHFMETLGNITVVCECVLGIITFILLFLLDFQFYSWMWLRFLNNIFLLFLFISYIWSLALLYIFTFLYFRVFLIYWPSFLMYIYFLVFPSYNNRKVFNS